MTVADDLYKVRMIWGVKLLPTVRCWISTITVPRWYFWTREQFYMESEYMKLGPFDTREEAERMMQWVRIGSA